MDKPPEDKKTQIPLWLFNRIVELMDSLGPPDDDALLAMFNAVKGGLREKRISMLYRDSYAKVICAKDDSQRKEALNNYVNTKLWYKNQ